MIRNREWRNIWIVAGLVFLAGVLHVLETKSVGISICFFYVINTFYICLIALWGISIYRRVLRKEAARYLTVMAGCMIVWLLLRIFKYRLTGEDDSLSRMLDNMYAIPFVLMPLMSYYASLYLKPSAVHDRYKLWWIPALVLIALCLTNEMHHLAYGEQGRAYGILVYIRYIWLFAFMVATVVNIIRCCGLSVKRNYMGVFFAIVCLVAMYGIEYTHGPFILSRKPYELQEFFSLTILFLWEYCCLTNLLPTNRDYDVIFPYSSLGAEIEDPSGNSMYQTYSFVPAGRQAKKKSLEAPLMTTPDIAMKGFSVYGGYGYVQMDLSLIHAMQRELRESHQALSEKVELLKAENRKQEENYRVLQQNRLYDKITRRVQPQLEWICTQAESQLPQEEILRRFCVVGAYVKRQANLMLMTDQGKVSSEELLYAIREIFYQIRSFGIVCRVSQDEEVLCDGQRLSLYLEAMENVLEAALGKCTVFHVELVQDRQMKIKMDLTIPVTWICPTGLQEHIHCETNGMMLTYSPGNEVEG